MTVSDSETTVDRLQVLRVLLRWLPAVAVMALIYFLSDQPNLSSGLGIWDLIGRKILHMAEFGLLFAALYRALSGAMLSAALVSVAYAISDEIHQSYVVGRQGAASDVLIDCVGIAVAIYLVRRGVKLRQAASERLRV